jgi:hypothetical protein
MARPDPPTTTAAAASRRADLARSAGLFVAYALVTVWWSWPGIWNWSTKVAYSDSGFRELEHADFYLITWTLSWVSHALATAPRTLFDGNTFFPAKMTVAFSESMLGHLPLFAPVFWLSDNPILATNVTTALTYPLSALFMYRFARLHVGEAPAALSGFFYAFTIARYTMPPHLQSLGIQYFPLVLLAIEQWLRRAQVRYLVLLFVALTLQALSSAYLLYALFLMVCPFVAAAAWHHRATLDRRRVVGLAVAGLAAGGVVGAFMWPYLVLRDFGLMTSYDDQHTALGLIPYFAKRAVVRNLLEPGIGPVGFALALAGVLFGRGRTTRWAWRLALLLVAVGTVFSFGPRIDLGYVQLWSPYVWLRDVIPGFATIRAPGRFTVVAELGLALLAGLGAERLLRGRRPAFAAGAAGALCLTALALMEPFPPLPLHAVPVHGAIPPAYRWLCEHGGGRAVLELPQARGYDGRAFRAYLSTAHWQPIVGGYAANAPKHDDYVYWIAQNLPAERALQRIVDLMDVGWILLHRDELDPDLELRWAETPLDGIELAGEWEGDQLFRVTLPPRDDRRARLLSTTETLNGLRIAPLAADCAGALAFVDWLEEVKAPRDGARLRILVSNRGTATWPALGFLPRDLVALEVTTLRQDGQAVGGPWRLPLPDDIAPDRPTPAYVRFETPIAPGPYTLRIRLIQPGEGVLDRCVAPLEIPIIVPPATLVASTAP